MTADPRADAQALVERTTAAQGLPLRVEDPAVLARVAAIIHTQGEGGGVTSSADPRPCDRCQCPTLRQNADGAVLRIA